MLLYVRVVHALSRLAGVAAALMIFAAVVLVCQLVIVRYVLNASTVWQTETVVFLMVGATLVGMPYVQLLRGHINVDLVPLYLPPTPRRWLFLACIVVQAAAVLVIGYYALELFLEAWHRNWRSPSVWGPPLWIPYLAMPLGFGLLVLQYAADLLMAFRVEDPFTHAGEPRRLPEHVGGQR
jgi:TRAP-type C4-dicarboxylate transport system permease small subunit